MERRWSYLALALTCAYFLALAHEGLGAYFMPDDMMNLYGYWTQPFEWSSLVNFFGDVFRPGGALFYLPLFHWFGFDPLPFRIACFALLLFNLWVAWRVAARLSGSAQVAALATLLFAYHGAFVDLYFSTGTVYDLLCFPLTYGAALLYFDWRRQPWLRIPAMILLYVLALDTKEIAAALPLILAAYEALYGNWRRRAVEWVPLAVVIAITAVYTASRLTGLVGGNPAYRPVFTLEQLIIGLKFYMGALIYRSEQTPLWLSVALFAGPGVIALTARSRLLALSWCIFVAGALTVLFIPTRGGFVLYLPWLGAALYLAVAIMGVVGGIRRQVSGFRFEVAWFWLAFVGLLGLLVAIHLPRVGRARNWVDREQSKVRTVVEGVAARYPKLPAGSRLLLRNNPFDEGDYAPLMALRLYYRDKELQVDTAAKEGAEYFATIELPAPQRNSPM